jgi:hypothetical protein
MKVKVSEATPIQLDWMAANIVGGTMLIVGQEVDVPEELV